ncbi:MAG: AbrB/MazE/SpoVT family DNA-binding domain-containing protein [Saprospiraceae bacterium]|nr:AbrB/MazE/SpoVT family DNA-binding domain-containing protein [Bacteroidia bacterium]NNE13651.1 AbrB/MazE/SpoVT family DNA-binding domain-containing protein [Saprospiraceae bacterium]NNL91829.1 AbrB/MazE/SpoVT family DNA-binding domain-containing protein [Saprospiraceae bacterium]
MLDKSNFSIEAIVSCDDRGQLVLPKDIRNKLDIQPGDKLAVLKCSNSNNENCLTLIKTDSLEQLVKTYLGPMMKDIVR